MKSLTSRNGHSFGNSLFKLASGMATGDLSLGWILSLSPPELCDTTQIHGLLRFLIVATLRRVSLCLDVLPPRCLVVALTGSEQQHIDGFDAGLFVRRIAHQVIHRGGRLGIGVVLVNQPRKRVTSLATWFEGGAS